MEMSCQYNLTGIINHYGSLTYGHYTSFVRNPYSQEWFKYDDQNRIPIQTIAKENAYILFYTRKDLKDIVPSGLFPGKPLKLQNADGFLLGRKPESKNKFVAKIGDKVIETAELN